MAAILSWEDELTAFTGMLQAYFTGMLAIIELYIKQDFICSKYVQCSAIIVLSIFSKIITIDNL